METFSQKYPSLAALIVLVAGVSAHMAISGESALQKVEGEVAELPDFLSFIPQAGLLSAELSQIKSSPVDIESAAEALVTDLAFSSVKAKAIIAAAFPFAEGIVALVPQGQALISALKS